MSISILILVMGATALFCALFACAVWRRRAVPGALPFLVLMVAVSWWAIFSALQLSTTDFGLVVLLRKVQYIGIVTIPVSWFLFVLEYSRHGDLRLKTVLPFCVIPVLTLAFCWTYEWHTLFYSSVALADAGDVVMRNVVHGPWWYVNSLYNEALIIVGFILLLRMYFTSSRLFSSQIVCILAGGLIPWGFSVLNIAGFSPFSGIDMTPAFFTFTAFIVYLAVFRSRLFTIVPVARDLSFDRMTDGVVVLDAQLRVVDLNRAACRFIDRPFADAAGLPAWEVVPGWSWKAGEEEPDLAHLEFFRCEEDQKHYYDLQLSRLFEGQTKRNGYLLVIRDVTAGKKAEIALLESENRMNLAIEGARLGIWDWNFQEESLIVNDVFSSLTGWDERELSDILLSEDAASHLIHPDDRPGLLEFMSAFRTGEEHDGRFGFRMYHSDGHLLWILLIGRVVAEDEEGRPLRIIGIAVDQTETERSQAALRETNRKLNLLSSLTRHDILNQINPIFGYATILKNTCPENPTIADYSDKILAQALTIQRQITFTADYQDLGVKEPLWQDIVKVAQKAKAAALLDGIEVEINTDSWEVYADPLLGRVFFNLFDNSVRHARTASHILVSFTEKKSCGLLVVEDDGKGIPDSEKEEVFEKGYGENTGFGLFLSKEILGITGIGIRETGTEGARFEMTIPRDRFRRKAS